MEILNKNRFEWSLILAAALGAYGGFPEAPLWWKMLTHKEWFQFLNLFLLIFAGAGFGQLYYSLLISILIYIIMKYSDRLVRFGKEYKGLKYHNRFYNN